MVDWLELIISIINYYLFYIIISSFRTETSMNHPREISDRGLCYEILLYCIGTANAILRVHSCSLELHIWWV